MYMCINTFEYCFFFFQNYNKSRIHSFRGAKDVIIKLNDITIFDGEIAKASGDDMGSLDSFGDVRNFIEILRF